MKGHYVLIKRKIQEGIVHFNFYAPNARTNKFILKNHYYGLNHTHR